MRASGGGGCAVEGHCHSSARRLLDGGGGGVAPAAPLSLSADRARLERALCATTAVLFAASLTYVALSTIFACLRAARRQQPSPDAEPAAAAVEMMETTKRALDEIPVVVVVHVRDGEDEECAVCLAAYSGGEEVRVLPACRHGFHRDCVDRWLLTRAPTCPVCRAPVVAASSEARDGKGCASTDDIVLPVAS